MSQIPAELTNHIIDYLHADKDALAACSMVCKAWLPRARHHVFGRMRIELSTADRLFELINFPLSTITPYVHHLDIGSVRGSVRLVQLAVSVIRRVYVKPTGTFTFPQSPRGHWLQIRVKHVVP